MWHPMELPDNVDFPVPLEHRCPVWTVIVVIRRRENAYDTGVMVALAVYAIPIYNLNQQELRVIRRRVRRTQPSATVRR